MYCTRLFTWKIKKIVLSRMRAILFYILHFLSLIHAFIQILLIFFFFKYDALSNIVFFNLIWKLLYSLLQKLTLFCVVSSWRSTEYVWKCYSDDNKDSWWISFIHSVYHDVWQRKATNLFFWEVKLKNIYIYKYMAFFLQFLLEKWLKYLID